MVTMMLATRDDNGVGGDEDDQRHGLARQALGQRLGELQAVGAGHLHVQQQQAD